MEKTENKVLKFIKDEPVLTVAAIAALISAFFVKPDMQYIDYIDFKVISVLFCLMAVVAGFSALGVFDVLAQKLTKSASNERTLAAVLIMLCFFSSMLITNDVALITFVPFAITLLGMCSMHDKIIPVLTLQTIAANIGSSLTPVGNPQNLFLYSTFSMNAGSFFSVTVPIVLAGFVLLVLCCLIFKPKKLTVPFTAHGSISDKKAFIRGIILFLLSIGTVFSVIPVWLSLAAVLLELIIFRRELFKHVDYMLLITFVCFFVFVGNIARIDAVREVLSSLLTGRELVVSVLLSQVISNVPAAVMLSGFTDNAQALVAGTNIGGLGTIIASLASLITFKFYTRTNGAKSARYLLYFTVVNVVMIIPMLIVGFFAV